MANSELGEGNKDVLPTAMILHRTSGLASKGNTTKWSERRKSLC